MSYRYLRSEMLFKMLLIFGVMSWASIYLFINKSPINSLMKLCLQNNELKYPSYCDEFSRIQYKFTINASDVCKNHPDIQILLAVYSTPNHRNRRDEIRRGWGSTRLYNKSHTKIIFVLGSSPNYTINESLRRESALYGDIIQQSYMESYFNLSLKARSWIEWTAKYCPEAKFAGKTDDDIFVDIVALSNLFESLTYKHRSNSSAIPDPNNLIFGYKYDNNPVIRDLRSKYGLAVDEYWENRFMEYCSGAGYFIGKNLISKFAEAAYCVPLFKFEDIWITGILRQLVGARLWPINNFYRFPRIKKQPNTIIFDLVGPEDRKKT